MSISRIIFPFLSIMAFSLFLSMPSCTHDPFPITIDPIDTMDKDTMVIDTPKIEIDTTGIKCDTNLVFYVNHVAPILKQHCAISGCHGGGSSKDGVSYETHQKAISTGKIKPFDLEGSKMYKVITSTKNSELMPPSPNQKLSVNEINIISRWILQGAKNDECNPNFGNPIGCKEEATYKNNISKIIQENCIGCHKNTGAQGNVNLQGYDNVKKYADSGKLYATIAWLDGAKKMPLNGDKLDECSIKKLKYWIDNGAKND